MAVGNFSVIPSSLLGSGVVVSEIWNHYSAGVRHARIPYRELVLARGRRLAGPSKMDVVSLITHGLSSIAVWSETVGTRVILAVTGTLGLVIALLLVVVGIRLFTQMAIPGCATYTSGLLIILMSQLVAVGMVLSIIILSVRHNTSVIPIRDYPHFVDGLRHVFP